MMPAERLEMHLVKEVLRLTSAGLSQRQIARALRISTGTIANYQQAARRAAITWPLPEQIDDAALGRLLWPDSSPPTGARAKPSPDWPELHQQLKRKGVTRQLLWEEYCQEHPDHHYRYTQFCERYNQWLGRQKLSLRQTHLAGEKLFVDYCGPTVSILDPISGAQRPAQIFVAVLGASNYTYAEATFSQSLPDWIASHVRAFAFFGGVPQLIVPDNLKSGVTKACRYEPALNATYAEMLEHYATTALPARPYKPRDKAKVEVAVQVVERWILARLRKMTFFSLAELNQAIAKLLEALNHRPFKKLPGTRRSQFEALDAPALKPLPDRPYEYADWKTVTVNIDYHVEIEGHYYSVPYTLVRQKLEARITARAIELLQKGQRIAAHPRSQMRGKHTTDPEHLPQSHRAHLEWTPGRFLNWAIEIGPYTRDLVRHLLESHPHPEQGYRSCLGLLNLERRYGRDRLERACHRALNINSPTRRSVLSILKQGLDRLPLMEEVPEIELWHENLRGSDYYQ
jgi:transposase